VWAPSPSNRRRGLIRRLVVVVGHCVGVRRGSAGWRVHKRTETIEWSIKRCRCNLALRCLGLGDVAWKANDACRVPRLERQTQHADVIGDKGTGRHASYPACICRKGK
jgi:hypothetical protein